jgi:pimeloyl-ACP methyl ester carboxylesterase
MGSCLEGDRMGYAFALKVATERGDIATVDKLRRNGPPPYYGSDTLWKNLDYLNVLNAYAAERIKPEETAGLPTMMGWLGSKYGLVDRVNFFRGLLDTFTVVYPQLYTIDFSRQATRLDVPVYFIQGRWDLLEMGTLLERYYNVLQAPHKEVIYFENAGHAPHGAEPSKFIDVMVNHVLAQTYH